jgi:hypothetical protein
MKPRIRIWLRAAALAAAVSLLGAERIDPQRYLEHIKYLASPELKGRGSGTPELDKAAEYIARQFRLVGLTAPARGGYYQPFPMTTSARLGRSNRLAYSQGAIRHELKLDEDFRPLSFSASGRIEGPVVFVGYGISAPEYGYDDYAGVDVRDKLVLMLRHEPQEFDENSVFGGKVYTSHSQFESKAVNAKFRGARAVLFVSDRHNHSGEEDTLEKFSGSVGPAGPGIPFVQVKASVAEQWLALAGSSLEALGKSIDQDMKPRSFALPESLRVHLEVDVEKEVRTVRNVLGYLPGATAEHLIIGAHYDHLGLGYQFSMAPSMAGTPHLGADDNASGTAGLIELARWFASRPRARRGILFVAFAGEEHGLLGSNFYANNPVLPLKDAVAMINMDMIGRPRDNKVYVGGVGTGTGFRALLEQLNGNGSSRLQLDLSESGGYGSSDHYSFTPKQVPVLFFFSGLHSDYHKPSDTWDKIDAPAAARLLDLVAAVAERLVEAPERPQFVRVAEPRPPGTVGGGGGYGAYFGSVPDFGQTSGGVKFADVRDGSPAARAGLRAGDVLVEFDGKPIDNLYDFTYALRSRKPGDEVVVKVRRGAEVLTVRVRLEQRR